MKERYFSAESLTKTALALSRSVRRHRRARGAPFCAERSALLVLDMQTYFLEPSSHAYVPSAEAILPLIRESAQAYSARGLPLVYTQHLNSDRDAGLMQHWWREMITADHPLGAIAPSLDLSSGIVLRKSQYDAFYRTPLEDLLRRRAVSQLVLCGVMTHLCCETTARSAFVRGFEVFFPIDGTATYNRALHRASLLNLAHGFATLVFMREILAALGAGGEA